MNVWYEMTAVSMINTFIGYILTRYLIGVSFSPVELAFCYFSVAAAFFWAHRERFLAPKEDDKK